MKAKKTKQTPTNEEKIRSLNNAVLDAVRGEYRSVATTQILRKPAQVHCYPHELGVTIIEQY